MGFVVGAELECVFEICGGADFLFCLTADLFRLRRVTWKSRNAAPPPSNQGCLLLVWPSFLGFPHFGDAPWARRHPPSMAGGGSRGIHAARPTARRLRSACTQVAICVVWEIAHLEAKSRANAAFDFYAIPVGDAGGHDGTGRDSDDSGLSVANESPDLPSSSERGMGCRTAPTGFGVQLGIWIRHVIAARLIGLWLTPDLFRLRRVT
jgi:hypothetical protein